MRKTLLCCVLGVLFLLPEDHLWALDSRSNNAKEESAIVLEEAVVTSAREGRGPSRVRMNTSL
jgi:hypothetical protein